MQTVRTASFPESVAVLAGWVTGYPSRESTLDIVKVGASQADESADGDEDNDIDYDHSGLYGTGNGAEITDNMLDAGYSEGYYNGSHSPEDAGFNLSLGEFVESHQADDDASPMPGAHRYVLAMGGECDTRPKQHRLCVATADGKLKCDLPCPAPGEADYPQYGTCLGPDNGTSDGLAPFEFTPDNDTLNWSDFGDYIDFRLFEVGSWAAPVWEYRLWNPIQFWCYDEEKPVCRDKLLFPREATTPEERNWVKCFAYSLEEGVSSIRISAVNETGKGMMQFSAELMPEMTGSTAHDEIEISNGSHGVPAQFWAVGKRASANVHDAVVAVSSIDGDAARDYETTVVWVDLEGRTEGQAQQSPIYEHYANLGDKRLGVHEFNTGTGIFGAIEIVGKIWPKDLLTLDEFSDIPQEPTHECSLYSCDNCNCQSPNSGAHVKTGFVFERELLETRIFAPTGESGQFCATKPDDSPVKTVTHCVFGVTNFGIAYQDVKPDMDSNNENLVIIDNDGPAIIWLNGRSGDVRKRSNFIQKVLVFSKAFDGVRISNDFDWAIRIRGFSPSGNDPVVLHNPDNDDNENQVIVNAHTTITP